MLVNILITFYNQESYVDDALKSVLEQQTNFPFKLLIGDDGSTDGTVDKIKRWMDLYPGQIELFIWERKGDIPSSFRLSHNRLRLMQHMQCEYFSFLDGDDFYTTPCKLQRQVDALQSYDHQDCIACAHNILLLYPDKSSACMVASEVPEGKYALKDYWGSLYFHTNTLLIRSRSIAKMNLQLLENQFDDVLITFSLLQQGSLYYIPESMAVYRQTGSGLWSGSDEVLKQIKNMFVYDYAIRINPDCKKITDRAMTFNWRLLARLRHQIHANQLHDYEAEARRQTLSNTLSWIRYNELSFFQRLRLLNKAYIITKDFLVWDYRDSFKKLQQTYAFVQNVPLRRFLDDVALRLIVLRELQKYP